MDSWQLPQRSQKTLAASGAELRGGFGLRGIAYAAGVACKTDTGYGLK
jgi:hypothetical protein